MPLTQDRDTPMQATDVLAVPVAGNVRIFTGALVVVNDTGNAIPGITSPDVMYLGRAEQCADNRGGSAGALRIVVRRNRAFQWANDGSINATHLLKTAYIVDDQTVGTGELSETHSVAGRIIGVEALGVWVEQSDFREEKSPDVSE